MLKNTTYRYISYHGDIYILAGVSFNKNLDDYYFHILELAVFKNLPNDNQTVASIKIPMSKCKEIEGKELEILRVLYES